MSSKKSAKGKKVARKSKGEREALTDAAIHRFCRRAGIQRISAKGGDSAYDTIRSETEMCVGDLVDKAYEVAVYNGRGTIMRTDVATAAELKGTEFAVGFVKPKKETEKEKAKREEKGGESSKRKAGVLSGIKPTKSGAARKPGALARIQTNRLQETDAFMIRKGEFKRLVAKDLKKYTFEGTKSTSTKFRISSEALMDLQTIIEYFISRWCVNAEKVMTASSKKTLRPKHLDAARSIKHDCY